MAHEYRVIGLPPSGSADERERQWTERLNAMAAQGWHLVASSTHTAGNLWVGGTATFEREIP